jgi:hypothetical protein
LLKLIKILIILGIASILIASIFYATLENNSEISAFTSPNLKVAFIADQNLGEGAIAVLELIKNEKTDMVIHSGDFDYIDNPELWDEQINQVLGNDFPYFASIGNHDIKKWDEYQNKIKNRIEKIDDIECKGDIGIKSSCNYKGLFFILSGVGIKGSNHEEFIKNELEDSSSIWRICSWHLNMNKMQTGEKEDGTGWEVYEECRIGGAMVVTGHEHSYQRTKTMIDFENQIVDPKNSDPNEITIDHNSSFVVVNGLGGGGIRDQDRCLPTTYPYGCDEWAKIYSSDQEAEYGALFCSFHINENPFLAHCYFKNISGEIVDDFTIQNKIRNTPNSNSWD